MKQAHIRHPPIPCKPKQTEWTCQIGYNSGTTYVDLITVHWIDIQWTAQRPPAV